MLAERLATDAGFYASGWNFGPAGDDNQGIADELVRLWGDPRRIDSRLWNALRVGARTGVNASKASTCPGLASPCCPLAGLSAGFVDWYRAF